VYQKKLLRDIEHLNHVQYVPYGEPSIQQTRQEVSRFLSNKEKARRRHQFKEIDTLLTFLLFAFLLLDQNSQTSSLFAYPSHSGVIAARVTFNSNRPSLFRPRFIALRCVPTANGTACRWSYSLRLQQYNQHTAILEAYRVIAASVPV